MSRAVALFLLAATACSPGAPTGPGVPLSYRIISSGRNHTPCVAGPEFRVARGEGTWIDVYDMHTACRDEREFKLPRIAFGRELAIGAWWAIDPCPGRDVELRAVEEQAGELAVIAGSAPFAGEDGCAGSVGVETLLAVERPAGVLTSVRFVMDGRTLGTVVLD